MKVISTDKAPGAIGPYSQGYIVGDMVFTSGQIPIDPATGEMAEGIDAQTEQSCKNVMAILEAAGSGADKVIKTTCFLAEISYEDPVGSCPGSRRRGRLLCLWPDG